MKYGVQLYYRFLLLFQTMPLAALVTTAYGDLFLCHGGLSPDILTIEALDELDRFVEPEENSALLDILWSDPISEERVDDMTGTVLSCDVVLVLVLDILLAYSLLSQMLPIHGES